MGLLLSREPTTDTFEKALEAIDVKLRKEQVYLTTIILRQASVQRIITIWILAIWGGIIAWVYYNPIHFITIITPPSNPFIISNPIINNSSSFHPILSWIIHVFNYWKPTILRFSIILIGPFIVYLSRYIVNWYFDRSRNNSLATIDALRIQQKHKIEELKQITAFYRAKELIERYESHLDPNHNISSNIDTPRPNQPYDHNNNYEITSPSMHETRPSYSLTPISLSKTSSSSSSHTLVREKKPNLFIKTINESLSSGTDNDNTPTNKNNTIINSNIISQKSNSWLGKIVERVLVGQDNNNAKDLNDQQKYALICGYCYQHNGLALPNEFNLIRYICRYCATLNDRVALLQHRPWLYRKIDPDAPIPTNVKLPSPSSTCSSPLIGDTIGTPITSSSTLIMTAANIPLPPSPCISTSSGNDLVSVSEVSTSTIMSYDKGSHPSNHEMIHHHQHHHQDEVILQDEEKRYEQEEQEDNTKMNNNDNHHNEINIIT